MYYLLPFRIEIKMFNTTINQGKRNKKKTTIQFYIVHHIKYSTKKKKKKNCNIIPNDKNIMFFCREYGLKFEFI